MLFEWQFYPNCHSFFCVHPEYGVIGYLNEH